MTNSMNLEMSEVFLLVWAVLATVAAGYFQHNLRKATRGAVILCMILEAIAKGDATLKTHPDGRMTFDMGDHEMTIREVHK